MAWMGGDARGESSIYARRNTSSPHPSTHRRIQYQKSTSQPAFGLSSQSVSQLRTKAALMYGEGSLSVIDVTSFWGNLLSSD